MPCRCRLCCKACSRKFSCRTSFNQHMQRVHQVPTEKSRTRTKHFKCLQVDDQGASCECPYYRTHKLLIKHLEETHGMMFQQIVFAVASMDEFQVWKKEIEKENISCYILKTKNGNTTYFYCNRSYTNKKRSEEANLRKAKSQGSCKMNSYCTSYIKLQQDSNKITITWQKTHYGHEPQLEHIRLHQEDKLIVASKLINGIPTSKIVQAAKDSVGDNPKRIDLLNYTDVYNIKKSFVIETNFVIESNLTSTIKDNNDCSINSNISSHALCQQATSDRINKEMYCKSLAQSVYDDLKKMNFADYSDEVLTEIFRNLLATNALVNKCMPKPSTDFSQPLNCEPQNDNIKIEKKPPRKKKRRRNSDDDIFELPTPEETIRIKRILLGEEILYVSKDSSYDHKYI